MPRRRRSAKRASLGLALGVGAAIAALSWWDLLAPLDTAIYDQLVTRIPAPAIPGDTVVVGIDEPSFAEVNLPWPWPRELHARLIDSLRAAGARVIAFDIVFADPTSPEGDARLAAAIGPDVVLASDLARIDTPQGQVAMLVQPLPALLAAGARTGVVGVPLDADGGVRRIPELDGSFAAALLADTPAVPDGALIDARPRPGAQARVAYYQALDAANLLPEGALRDKVVLVGLTLRATPDTRGDKVRTPWTARGAGLSPGVEVQARLFETLSHRSWITPVPPWAVLAAALLAVALGILTARGRWGPAGAAAAGGLGAGFVALSGGLLATGLWLPPAAPALAALVAGIGQAALDHARERAARRAITRSFEHYVSPEVVRRLAADPDTLALGGERRHLTIMFCDMRGFTTLSERMRDRPEELTALINRALTILGDAILESGGMIDKFIGDCAMGVWNAPVDVPDHPRRAVEAAIAAVTAVRRFAEEVRAEAQAAGQDAPDLACGAGVNTGWCTVGNMGSTRRFDYTAIGDPVNLASRLEGLTKTYGTPVILGEDTAAHLGDLPLVELDTAVVKGRAAPVRIFTPAALWPVTADALALQAAALAASRRGDRDRAAMLWHDLARRAPEVEGYATLMAARLPLGRSDPVSAA